MASAEARALSLLYVCVCCAESRVLLRSLQAAEAVSEGYGSRAFWDARYEDSAATLFDWYQDYEALAQLLLVRAHVAGVL
jgi:hypothetical protein